jgi:hypothetical protein
MGKLLPAEWYDVEVDESGIARYRNALTITLVIHPNASLHLNLIVQDYIRRTPSWHGHTG